MTKIFIYCGFVKRKDKDGFTQFQFSKEYLEGKCPICSENRGKRR